MRKIGVFFIFTYICSFIPYTSSKSQENSSATHLACRYRTTDGHMLTLPSPTIAQQLKTYHLTSQDSIHANLYFLMNDTTSPQISRKSFVDNMMTACDKAKMLYLSSNNSVKDLQFIEYGTISNQDNKNTPYFHKPFFMDVRNNVKHPSLPFVQMVVFGDSLSDNGNSYDAHVLPTWLRFLEWPYFAGRPTNGPTWVEDIAKRISETEKGFFDLYNYAQTGSGAATPGYNPIGDLNTQVKHYLVTMDNNKTIMPNWDPAYDQTLFVILTGSNDYMLLAGQSIINRTLRYLYCDSVSQNSKDSQSIKDVAEGCAKAVVYGNSNARHPTLGIKGEIQKIITHAKNTNGQDVKYFIIPKQPDFSKSPYYTTRSHRPLKNEISFLQNVIRHHNKMLTQAIYELERDNPNIKILSLPLDMLVDSFITNPNDPIMRAAGVTNKQTSCFPTGPTGPFENVVMCDDPENYLFWDGIHPTMAAHCAIAEYTVETIYNTFSRQKYDPKYAACHKSFTHKSLAQN